MTDWNMYAQHGDLRSVIDPADNLGYKNNYINLLHHKVLSKNMKNLDGKRVLDLGCGIGRFTEFLQSNGAIVTGVDSCSDMLKMNTKCRTVCAPITSLPFDNGSFDVILSVWTLQFLNSEDLKLAINEMQRVLSPIGEVYFIEQVSLSGYDDVYNRLPQDYDVYFGEGGFSLKSCRPINGSSDKIIAVVRRGWIPEKLFSHIIPLHLLLNWSMELHSGYIDYFMNFGKCKCD